MCKNRSKKGRIILKFALKYYEPGTKPGTFSRLWSHAPRKKQDGPIYCQARPCARFMLGPSITHTTFAAININQKLLDGITSVAKLLSNANPFESLGSHFCSLMSFFFTIFTLFYCSQKTIFLIQNSKSPNEKKNIVVFLFQKYDKFQQAQTCFFWWAVEHTLNCADIK